MVIPVVALVVSIWLTTHASMKSWVVTGVFMLLGSVLYLVTRHRKISE
jgi:hypothetical protein